MESARTIVCTTQRCAIFGDTHKSFGETTDFLAIVESPPGKIAWAKTYGGTNRDELRTAAAAADGGFLMIGKSESLFFTALKVLNPNRPARPFIVRIDSSGNPRWAATVEDGRLREVMDAAQVNDDSHFLVGYGVFEKVPEVVAIRASSDGEIVWAYRYPIGTPAYGISVIPTSDDGAMIVGSSAAPDGNYLNGLGIRIDANGIPSWARVFGGESRLGPLDVVRDSGSGFLLVGTATDKAGAESAFALSLSPTGTPIWSRSYEGAARIKILSALAGHGTDLVLIGRTGDVHQRQLGGLAILLDRDGSVKADVTVKGEGNTELLSAERFGEVGYRLIGDTDDFGAAMVDILSLDWIPSAARRVTSRPIGATAEEIRVVPVPLQLEVTRIPVSALETDTLTVPTR